MDNNNLSIMKNTTNPDSRLPGIERMEFHVSRKARDRYRFDLSLFSTNGNVIFANLHGSRLFAQKMNEKRDLVNFPEQAVQAGQINAMGLIDEILHLIVEHYRQETNPQVMANALEWLTENIGSDAVDISLHKFTEEFPPLTVYTGRTSLDTYISGETDGVPNRENILEEMILLWIANANPAFAPFLELFDDSNLERETTYNQIISNLHSFFSTQPGYGQGGLNLIDLLRSPALAHPHSLTGQLDFIQSKWGNIIGKHLYRLLTSLDLIKEEEKPVFLGPGPALIYEFTGLEREPEMFSQDRDWMPNLVLVAKNAFVWLDQLSKKYARPLTRLDHLPDEELDNLAQWGFTGLWLIGIWERSPSSKRIKLISGKEDAVASAYSLFSYEISDDLGGDEAYQALRERAWKRGIRLAADMVPNHMGIDSKWVIDHPNWFISLDYSPFPAYTFTGTNLSWDQRVGIYIEDHYYDHTDAAVVFKRVDHWTGQEKYIYHGNDGTAMPWNDTAQLDYLNPEVREAVIQTILHVARKFPVIRFDAAMTLAKRHYQRLWYPEPGSGGDIPSRAEHGLSRDQFNEAMPVEFWREVVDRVATEVPDTLLLAEAFWLMEGYFVRTLGMHRVYNSAFMNMLRDEKNQDYRLVVKNTLQFDPEILKRFVNFMNNPDERTAVDQFGSGDKYFGICTLLATLPGLPMFGHGQIEGFTEKYGMEYRRAYWDEKADEYLVERHKREIFPLLRRRYLFAEADHFLFFDFVTPDGNVNEDVFAYSNRAGSERALVVYHNRYADTRGWIHKSTSTPVKTASGDRIMLVKSLAEGLGIKSDHERFTIFRDHRMGLEYIRNNQELWDQGFYIELGAYNYHVFLDIREVTDNEWRQYSQITSYLGGRGVPSIEEAIKELFLQPILAPFSELANAGQLQWLIDHRLVEKPTVMKGDVLDEVEQKVLALLSSIQKHLDVDSDSLSLAKEIRYQIATLLDLPQLAKQPPSKNKKRFQKAIAYLLTGPDSNKSYQEGDPFVWGTLLGWIFVHQLGRLTEEGDPEEISRSWLDEWLLTKRLTQAYSDLGLAEDDIWQSIALVRILTSHQNWFKNLPEDKDKAFNALSDWLKDIDVQRFIQVNRYQGILWFNKEQFEELLWWMYLCSILRISAEAPSSQRQSGDILARYQIIDDLLRLERQSSYQLDELISLTRNPGKKTE